MKMLMGLTVAMLAAAAMAAMHDPPHADARDSERPAVGEQIRDFALSDSEGKAFRLAALRRSDQSPGTIAVLTFWCTTCPSCRMIERDLDRRSAEYRERGVQVFAVASNHDEQADAVNGFIKRHKLSFPVLMDPQAEVARYLGATATTTTAVIDAEGRLRYYGGYGKAEDAVRSLLTGEEVAVPETRAVGCEILFAPDAAEDQDARRDDHGKRH